jgi:ABC-type bacteriocin/lantibiotic exporter with double-glycine peptidase domain
MLHQGGITGCNTHHPSIGADEFIWALGSLSQLNRIPFDRALLLSQFPPPYDWSSLVQASTALGFRCEVAESPVETLDTWAFPCIAFVRHRTFNTLIVVAVAMALFMIFSAVMTWVRQYLILHTGNRIDAALGKEPCTGGARRLYRQGVRG